MFFGGQVLGIPNDHHVSTRTYRLKTNLNGLSTTGQRVLLNRPGTDGDIQKASVSCLPGPCRRQDSQAPGWLRAAASERQTLAESLQALRLRLGIVVAELQRQGAEDRRLVQRQLDHLERRLQARSFRQSVIKSVHDWKEQLGMPASRERWADLQASRL